LNKNKSAHRTNKVIFIYGTKGDEAETVRNKLSEVDIEKIVSEFKNFKDIESIAILPLECA
jgi:type I restriction-modification system DNA methylase subunit